MINKVLSQAYTSASKIYSKAEIAEAEKLVPKVKPSMSEAVKSYIASHQSVDASVVDTAVAKEGQFINFFG